MKYIVILITPEGGRGFRPHLASWGKSRAINQFNSECKNYGIFLRSRSWTKVLQMKWNYGTNSCWSAAGQIPGLNSLLCLVQVCPIVSVRGKTPIPMIPWGYSHHTWGSLNSYRWSMCRWKVPLLDKGMHDMRSRRERKQPGGQAPPLSDSQVPNLSIRGNLSKGRREEMRKFNLHFWVS